MITADDIARITIFAELGEDDRAQLARAAADIALSAGEYAAEQGAERALFGLLDGGIEVVQIVDGVERIVGRREPGDIFGEAADRSPASNAATSTTHDAASVVLAIPTCFLLGSGKR